MRKMCSPCKETRIEAARVADEFNERCAAAGVGEPFSFSCCPPGYDRKDFELFQKFDPDRRGSIPNEKMHIVLKSIHGGIGHLVSEERAQAKAATIVKEFDEDGNGFISFEEFVSMKHQLALRRQIYEDGAEDRRRNEEVVAIFTQFCDPPGSTESLLYRDGLEQLLRAQGNTEATEEVLDDLMAEADT